MRHRPPAFLVSITVLAAIIDRWQELEAQAPRIPTPVEALRLAAGAINRAQAAEDEKRYVGRTHLALPAGKPMDVITAITPHTRRTDIPHPVGAAGNYSHQLEKRCAARLRQGVYTF